jgi:nucleotide-binding universal stress UspA family protein
VQTAGKKAELAREPLTLQVSSLTGALPNNLIDVVVDVDVKPEDQILSTIQDCNCDVVMLGSHGRTGLSRFFLGSVSEAIARTAPCTVEIIRRPH